jgi:hypothetical protein
MNIVHFGEGTCERIRRYLDSYISNELLVETNHEVLRHLQSCPACSAELEARTRLKRRLKAAVQGTAVPEGLEVRVRLHVRGQGSGPALEWRHWAVAAALLIACAAAVVLRPWDRMPDLADRRGQDAFIQRVSQSIASVLRAGLGDHIHCAVFRRYPKDPPPLEQMAQSMGPTYKPLVPLVKASIGSEYRMIMAHQCGYGSRRFVHITLRRGSNLISLVVTRKKAGESLASMTPATRPAGIPVYQAAASRYEVAAFETDQYLAFVISDLSDQKNLQVAHQLAPAVHAFLAKIQG